MVLSWINDFLISNIISDEDISHNLHDSEFQYLILATFFFFPLSPDELFF